MERKIFLVSALAVFSMTPVLSSADVTTKCADRSDLAGPCYEVHGRLYLPNGTPSARIWVIGTNRILGLYAPPDADGEEAPDGIVMSKKVSSQIKDSATRIYADFLVCPFEKDIPGHMRMVCIESARNMIVEDLDDQGNDTYRRVPN